jgi:transcription-repair coupling factor (superfamily II helicase)
LPATSASPRRPERRLKVIQSLDTLGAGFQLASHDLDIRGAGNLLGEEQSGHIKEVGFELYQQMLEEAVLSMKAGGTETVEDRWSPQITIGMPVLIPEEYVADLSVRLGLYRRLADIDEEREIDAFGAELVDRFGPLPEEVQHLLKIVGIKALCRRANVEKVGYRPEGRGAPVPQRRVLQSGRPGRLHPRGGRQSAPRHEGRVLRRLGEARSAAQGHDLDPAHAGGDREQKKAA